MFANLGRFFVMYIVFMIKWHVARCFFHGLANLRSKKPPCWAVQFVSCGIGVALHVSSIVFENFSIMLSNTAHASFHWVCVRWSWFSRKMITVLICIEFSSMNLILNFPRFLVVSGLES